MTLSRTKFVALVDPAISQSAAGAVVRLKIETAGPAGDGIVLYGNFSEGVLCGYAAGRDAALSGSSWLDGTSSIASNAAGSNTTAVTIAACDAGGARRTVASGAISIRTIKRLDLAELFGGTVPADGFLRWTSSKNIHLWQEILQDGQGTVVIPVDYE